MKLHTFAALLFLLTRLASAQTEAPFSILVEPFSIEQLGGVQSFAWGQHAGKWLIVGGRLDGLHRRQPFATFDIAGHNNQLIVIDPVARQTWKAPLTGLSTALQEQLSSTNPSFYQQDSTLYVVGGYGYSATAGDHKTFPNLTAIDLSLVIQSVVQSGSVTSGFRQIQDTMFAVAGGRLEKLYETYYLVGGQRFDGRYNPMGPTHGPGFTQIYTNAIRRFTLADDGTNLVVSHLAPWTDSVQLHRRDYNVAPQIMPNGQEGLTAFSGVFQPTVDLPFLNCVNADSSGFVVNNSFSQYYNHYHCGWLPLYSDSANEMHTVFFGGIAQYYDSAGVLVQDNNAPFVKTIARVTRTADGTMTEYKLPVEMPTLLGAGSEVIPVPGIPRYANHVLKLDSLTADTTLVAYLYGGISSSAPNIFWVNDGTQSSANSQIFSIKIIKSSTNGIHDLNEQSIGTLHMQVFPNPTDDEVFVRFQLKQNTDLTMRVFDAEGRLLHEKTYKGLASGENYITRKLRGLDKKGVFMITLETPYETATQKVLLQGR